MAVWGKMFGGIAGFAVGGPFGALMGAALGHAADRHRLTQRGHRMVQGGPGGCRGQRPGGGVQLRGVRRTDQAHRAARRRAKAAG